MVNYIKLIYHQWRLKRLLHQLGEVIYSKISGKLIDKDFSSEQIADLSAETLIDYLNSIDSDGNWTISKKA